MIVVCKLGEENFTVNGSGMEIDIERNDIFSYTFWNKKRKFNRFYENTAIDLLNISFFVFAADRKLLRETSKDCWSRKITLYIPVLDLEKWESSKALLEKMVNFLSGDKWEFHFRERQMSGVEKRHKAFIEGSTVEVIDYEKVSMLSGGLDSFIGAIDLLESNKDKVMFVSHYGGGKGTKDYQDSVKTLLSQKYDIDENNFYQFYAAAKNGIEDSTRTRSFMFFSHAVALASAQGKDEIEIIIPENGLISLNIPLTNSRLGTSSTRTTHPYYMKLFRALLSELGLGITLVNPYQFQTKGEMVVNCANQDLIATGIEHTMSCSHPDVGRMRGETGPRHCGYCLPCTIRRAAIKSAGLEDLSIYYDRKFSSGNTAKTNFNSYKIGMSRFKPEYAFMTIQLSGEIEDDIEAFSELYVRGMMEINEFLEDISE